MGLMPSGGPSRRVWVCVTTAARVAGPAAGGGEQRQRLPHELELAALGLGRHAHAAEPSFRFLGVRDEPLADDHDGDSSTSTVSSEEGWLSTSSLTAPSSSDEDPDPDDVDEVSTAEEDAHDPDTDAAGEPSTAEEDALLPADLEELGHESTGVDVVVELPPQPEQPEPCIELCGLCRRRAKDYNCPVCDIGACLLDCWDCELEFCQPCADEFWQRAELDGSLDM